MDVNFNNVRRRAITSYNKVVRTLNHNINDGVVRISVDEIEDDLNDLRIYLATIALTSMVNNENFSDVLGENTLEMFNANPSEECL